MGTMPAKGHHKLVVVVGCRGALKNPNTQTKLHPASSPAKLKAQHKVFKNHVESVHAAHTVAELDTLHFLLECPLLVREHC